MLSAKQLAISCAWTAQPGHRLGNEANSLTDIKKSSTKWTTIRYRQITMSQTEVPYGTKKLIIREIITTPVLLLSLIKA